jgi:hypothetical protein
VPATASPHQGTHTIRTQNIVQKYNPYHQNAVTGRTPQRLSACVTPTRNASAATHSANGRSDGTPTQRQKPQPLPQLEHHIKRKTRHGIAVAMAAAPAPRRLDGFCLEVALCWG